MGANSPRPSFWRRALGLSDIGRKDMLGSGLTLVMPQWAGTALGETAKGYEQAIKFGFSRNELIYACIMATADAAASVSLRAYTPDEHEEIPQHPLRNLLQHPNPRMTEFDFWSLNVITNKLSGHGFWQIIRSRAGLPVQLWPLRPDWMTPMREGDRLNVPNPTQSGAPGPTGAVTQWRFGPPGGNFTLIPDADVVDFNLMTPKDPLYGGMAPVEVLSRTGDADNSVTDFLKGFFENGAMPLGILTSSQKLREDDSEYIRQSWRKRYGGWRNWTEPAVLSMDAKYQQIGLSFKAMAMDVLDDRAEARICMVMGVPAIVAGAHVGLKRSTFANYQEARLSWWEDHLFPMFAHYKDIIETQLADEFGGGYQVDWDFSAVPALQDDQNALRQHALDGFKAGAVMLDEYRDVVGLPPAPGGKGQVFFVPTLVTVVPADQMGVPPKPVAPPTPPPAVSAGAGDPAALTAGQDGKPAGDLPAPANDLPPGSVEKVLPLPAALKVGKPSKPSNLVERQQREAQLAGAVENYFARQRASIAEQLTSGA